MANDFYNYNTTLNPNTLAKAEAVAAELTAITQGFNLLPTLAEIRESRQSFGTDSGAADAYVITLPHPPSAYTAGLRASFVPTHNSTAAGATVNVYNANSVLIGTKAILRADGTATQALDISTAGVCDIEYNGTAFIMMGAPAGIISAAAAQVALAAAQVAIATAQAVISTAQASASAASATTASGWATTAQNWATQIGSFVTGSLSSAKEWAVGTFIRGVAGMGSARDWAIYTGGTADDTSYSAKEYAQGSQAGTGGSSKNWSQQTGADVTGAAANSRSAKSWAQDDLHGATLGGSAKDWSQSASLPDGTSKSSKSYASDAAGSAAVAVAAAASAGWDQVVFLTHADSPKTIVQADGGTLFSIDTSGGAVVINMPALAGLTVPYVVGFKKSTNDGNAMTLTGNGAEIFDNGANTFAVASPLGVTVIPHKTSPAEWVTSSWGGGTYTASTGVKLVGLDIQLDFSTLVNKVTPVVADKLAMYDVAAATHKYSTWTQILAAIFGTSAVVNTGTSGATLGLLNSANTVSGVETHTAGVVSVPVPLTDGASVTPDLSTGNNFSLIKAVNGTLKVPTNPVAGIGFEIDIWQDPTGSRTLAYDWIYTWAGGTAGVLSTLGCSLDRLFATIAYYATAVVTVTIAAPGVLTWTAHGLTTGKRLQLTTTGALPTGLAANTTYWFTKIDANTGKLSTSLANCAAGTFITTTGSQSGTHTAVAGDIGLSLNKAFA